MPSSADRPLTGSTPLAPDASSNGSSSLRPPRLDRRVAIVTGGASGIGLATVERIIDEGGRVVVGDLDDAGLAVVAERFGERVAVLHCDVTNEDGPAGLAALALERFGSLHIAVACAGIGAFERIVDHSLSAWQRVIDVNLTGTFLTVQAAARAMAGPGSIVAIASLNAVQPGTQMSAYCASKAGVVALVDVASLELGARGIRVNAVAPGLVRTPMTSSLWDVPEMVAGYTDNTALGRYAEPQDIAAAVAFLASDDASFVTGTTLLVDGGGHHLSYPDLGAIRAGVARGTS